MFRVPMSSSNATQALKTLAVRGQLLRSQLRARGPSFSTSSTDPVRGGPPNPPEPPGWFDRLDQSLASGGGTSGGPQSTLTEIMSQNPYKTMFTGMTLGYFVAMYIERTVNKDKFVRDHRHKTTTGAVTGLPTAK